MAAPFNDMPTGWWRHPSHIAKVRFAEALAWERQHLRRVRRRQVYTGLVVVILVALCFVLGATLYDLISAIRR